MPIGALGAAAILGAGALSFLGQRSRARQEGKGIAAATAEANKRRQAILDALGPEADRAQERLKDDDAYVLSDAREQELIDADFRDVKTQQKDALAEIVRGSEGDPLRAGRRMQLMRSVVGQGAGEPQTGKPPTGGANRTTTASPRYRYGFKLGWCACWSSESGSGDDVPVNAYER